MGADAVVEWHDGLPPGEDENAARMHAEGLSPDGWGNGPGDTYGWHEHGYEKVLYCVRGQIVFHTVGQYKGMKGNFVRTDGRITGISFAGRLAVKQ